MKCIFKPQPLVSVYFLGVFVLYSPRAQLSLFCTREREERSLLFWILIPYLQISYPSLAFPYSCIIPKILSSSKGKIYYKWLSKGKVFNWVIFVYMQYNQKSHILKMFSKISIQEYLLIIFWVNFLNSEKKAGFRMLETEKSMEDNIKMPYYVVSNHNGYITYTF